MPTGQKSRQRGVRISLAQADDRSLQTWVELMRVVQRVQRKMDRVLDHAGLSLPQFDVLANLGMTEGITQQELAERLLVTKGNVCGLLDRMESAGLVERRPDEADRRVNRLHLTRRGKTALHEAFPAHIAVIRDCLDALTVAEKRALAELVAKLEKHESRA
jgi:DNA-binding MarR family transcriptional regulator